MLRVHFCSDGRHTPFPGGSARPTTNRRGENPSSSGSQALARAWLRQSFLNPPEVPICLLGQREDKLLKSTWLYFNGKIIMATFANALKEEMRRLARKEMKAQTSSTSQAVKQQRKEITKLKRQVKDLERRLAYLQKQERKRLATPNDTAESQEGVRFSAKSVKSQRAKTGLSAADYAKLIGVSPLTIYNWEHGKTKPRQAQLAALVALRGIGKREAKAKLELLAGKK